MIDFSSFSLALVKDNKILHSSKNSGIRPLYECVENFMGKEDGCTLYDRAIGLAAARIIVHSGIIAEVITPLASKPAEALLNEHGIKLSADKIVENIHNREKTDICPMEKKALQASGNIEFMAELKKIFSTL